MKKIKKLKQYLTLVNSNKKEKKIVMYGVKIRCQFLKRSKIELLHPNLMLW